MEIVPYKNKELNFSIDQFVMNQDKQNNNYEDTSILNNWSSEINYAKAIKIENDFIKDNSVFHTQNDWSLIKNNYTIENDIQASNEVILKKNFLDKADLSFVESTGNMDAKVIDISDRIVRRPKPTTKKGRFLLMQRWEGYVLKIEEDTFISLIYDQTNSNNDPEEVELYLEDVSAADRPLLQEGAVFYWSIGYEDLSNGERRRSSIIRFRRLPAWSRKELRRFEDEALSLKSLLESNNSLDEIASF